MIRNRKPVKLLWEEYAVLMAWYSENKTYRGILDFPHWLNNRIRGIHEKRIAII